MDQCDDKDNELNKDDKEHEAANAEAGTELGLPHIPVIFISWMLFDSVFHVVDEVMSASTASTTTTLPLLPLISIVLLDVA